MSRINIGKTTYIEPLEELRALYDALLSGHGTDVNHPPAIWNEGQNCLADIPGASKVCVKGLFGLIRSKGVALECQSCCMQI